MKVLNQPFDFKVVDWNGNPDQISFAEVAQMLGVEVEGEAPTPDPLPDDALPFAPVGYDLALIENFSPPVLIQDGQTDDAESTWIDSFHKWRVRELDGNNDKGTKQYIPGVTHALTADGKLSLMAGADEMVDNGFYAGMISTEQFYAQRYGYWETRITPINVPDGYHFSVWLLRADGDYRPKSGLPSEIDMVEIVQGNGNNADILHFNDHPSQQRMTNLPWNGNPMTLGVGVHPHGVEWRLNGEVIRTSPVHYTDPMYLLMTWEVGGNWPGPVKDLTKVARIDVDYVAAFRKKAFGESIPVA